MYRHLVGACSEASDASTAPATTDQPDASLALEFLEILEAVDAPLFWCTLEAEADDIEAVAARIFLST